MPTPILATKLYIPPTRTKVVARARLIAQLNEGLQRKLTLISAPAGFGKTTLVSEWIAGGDRAVAWLSLEAADSDPTRFLTYLVAALQTIAPTIGEDVLALLQSSQPLPAETLLTTLLNEISTIPDNFILVLDDYHILDAKPIDDAVTFLIEHLPPQMHLVITTRDDPRLPLARLRARGQLTELRAADLRFSLAEAVQFLNEVMRLGLSETDIAALETRTEGWIAGLQLAALSVQGQQEQDVSAFIRAFAGDNHYIVDYLVDEVLQRQPEAVRSFLLRTSILDRLNGSLCDAVSGQQEGNARLEMLERGNFFVIPLDAKRHWYRYHHLFADVLYTHLRAEYSDLIPVLHRRASEWYEQHGSMAKAIHHALAAEDFARAASLIELAAPAMRRNREEVTLLGWLRAIPDQMMLTRPVLNVQYAGTLLSCGELESVEDRLWDAERWLEMDTNTNTNTNTDTAAAEMVVVDETEFGHLAASIAMYRAAHALMLGDVANTVRYAQRLLELAPENASLLHGAARALLGLAYWTSGDLEAAYKMYVEGMARLQKAGYIPDAVGGAIAIAEIRSAQGRLSEALRTYEQALQLAATTGDPALRGTADMYVGMSEIYRERNDLTVAVQQLQRSREQGDHTGFPQYRYRWRVAMARLREIEGDLEAALDLLHEAEGLYTSDFYPNVRPIAAMRVRLWIRQGRLREALGWVREQRLSAADDLSYLREYEHITLARVLLACYTNDGDGMERTLFEALDLLERLLQAAEQGGRTRSVIELLALQALARQMHGDLAAAIALLEHALTLAEPEGYIRLFVDEGSAMTILLEKAAKQGISPHYVRQLLSAAGKGKAEVRSPISQQLTDPLSERELEVLRLLTTDLDGPDLARELTVSLNTLRTHIKNIYTKLGVNNRRAAVRRAEELGLL